LDRLAVGDARRRLVVVPPLGRPHLPPQGVLDPVPGAVLLPLLEVPEGGVPVRQGRRRGPPGAPPADRVQDGIEDSPAGVLRRPAAGLVGRDQGLEDGPQLVAHPGRVRGGGRHPCRFHARETTLDRSTDSRLFSPQALRAKPVKWLVPGRIPLGKVTLLAADGGAGKSTLTRHVAAAVTTGRASFGLDYAAPPPGKVIL